MEDELHQEWLMDQQSLGYVGEQGNTDQGEEDQDQLANRLEEIRRRQENAAAGTSRGNIQNPPDPPPASQAIPNAFTQGGDEGLVSQGEANLLSGDTNAEAEGTGVPGVNVNTGAVGGGAALVQPAPPPGSQDVEIVDVTDAPPTDSAATLVPGEQTQQPRPQRNPDIGRLSYPGYPNLSIIRHISSSHLGGRFREHLTIASDGLEAFLTRYVDFLQELQWETKQIYWGPIPRSLTQNEHRFLFSHYQISGSSLALIGTLYRVTHEEERLARTHALIHHDLALIIKGSARPGTPRPDFRYNEPYVATGERRSLFAQWDDFVEDVNIDPNRIIHPFNPARGPHTIVVQRWGRERRYNTYPTTFIEHDIRANVQRLKDINLSGRDHERLPHSIERAAPPTNPTNDTETLPTSAPPPDLPPETDPREHVTLLSRTGVRNQQSGEIDFVRRAAMPLQPARFTNIVDFPPPDLSLLASTSSLINGIIPVAPPSRDAPNGVMTHPTQCVLTHVDLASQDSPPRSTFQSKIMSRAVPLLCDQCATLIFGIKNSTCTVPSNVVDLLEAASRASASDDIRIPCNNPVKETTINYPCVRFTYPFSEEPMGGQYPIVEKGTLMIPRIRDLTLLLEIFSPQLDPGAFEHLNFWTIWEQIRTRRFTNTHKINPVFALFFWRLLAQMIEEGVSIGHGGTLTLEEAERRVRGASESISQGCGSKAITTYVELAVYCTIMGASPITYPASTPAGTAAPLILDTSTMNSLMRLFETTSGFLHPGRLSITINRITREQLNSVALRIVKGLYDYNLSTAISAPFNDKELYPSRRLYSSLSPFFNERDRRDQPWPFFINGCAPTSLALCSNPGIQNVQECTWIEVVLLLPNINLVEGRIVSSADICNGNALVSPVIRELATAILYTKAAQKTSTSRALRAKITNPEKTPEKNLYYSRRQRRREVTLVTDTCGSYRD